RADRDILVDRELEHAALAEVPPPADRRLHAGITDFAKPRLVQRAVKLELCLQAPPRPRSNAASDEPDEAGTACVVFDDFRGAEQQAADAPVVRARPAPGLAAPRRKPRQREIRGAASCEPQLVAGRHL